MKQIPLTKGKVALVDDEDFDWLNKFNWFANKMGNTEKYRAIRNKTIDCEFTYMHRMILNITDIKKLVDHKDRNPLNNQRYNLRICSNRQNACNVTSAKNSKSKYLGVCYHDSIFRSKTKKGIREYRSPGWSAVIWKDYKSIFLGRFKTEIEAALAYNAGAIKYHGEFANLNVID